MTPFLWSAGHIGWPIFGIVVFSAVCILVSDVVWRIVQVSSRKLLLSSCAIWVAGVVIFMALYFA